MTEEDQSNRQKFGKWNDTYNGKKEKISTIWTITYCKRDTKRSQWTTNAVQYLWQIQKSAGVPYNHLRKKYYYHKIPLHIFPLQSIKIKACLYFI